MKSLEEHIQICSSVPGQSNLVNNSRKKDIRGRKSQLPSMVDTFGDRFGGRILPSNFIKQSTYQPMSG